MSKFTYEHEDKQVERLTEQDLKDLTERVIQTYTLELSAADIQFLLDGGLLGTHINVYEYGIVIKEKTEFNQPSPLTPF